MGVAFLSLIAIAYVVSVGRPGDFFCRLGLDLVPHLRASFSLDGVDHCHKFAVRFFHRQQGPTTSFFKMVLHCLSIPERLAAFRFRPQTIC
jgi:hypothetical protein